MRNKAYRTLPVTTQQFSIYCYNEHLNKLRIWTGYCVWLFKLDHCIQADALRHCYNHCEALTGVTVKY